MSGGLAVPEPYIPGRSILHRLNPCARFLLLLSTLVALSLPNPAEAVWLGWLAACLVAAVAMAGIPPSRLIKRALPALISAPFIALGACVRVGQEAQWGLAVGPYTIGTSAEALAQAAVLLWRACLAALAIGLYISVAPFAETVQAMQALRLPELFVLITALLYRYLFVLAGEAWRMERAREARTLRVPSFASLWEEAKVLASMIGSLFLRSYARSERVYWAMLSRGFSGSFATLRGAQWSAIDAVAPAAWALALLLGGVASRVLAVGVR